MLRVPLVIPFVYVSKLTRVFGLIPQVTPCWPSGKFFYPPTSRSLSDALLPLQNLAFHSLVTQRQSVVVLTVKMVLYFKPD